MFFGWFLIETIAYNLWGSFALVDRQTHFRFIVRSWALLQNIQECSKGGPFHFSLEWQPYCIFAPLQRLVERRRLTSGLQSARLVPSSDGDGGIVKIGVGGLGFYSSIYIFVVPPFSSWPCSLMNLVFLSSESFCTCVSHGDSFMLQLHTQRCPRLWILLPVVPCVYWLAFFFYVVMDLNLILFLS